MAMHHRIEHTDVLTCAYSFFHILLNNTNKIRCMS